MSLVREVFADSQFLVEARSLEDDTDPAPESAPLAEKIQTEDAGRAARRPNESGKDPEKGGLAAAVRPEKAEDFTWRDLER